MQGMLYNFATIGYKRCHCLQLRRESRLSDLSQSASKRLSTETEEQRYTLFLPLHCNNFKFTRESRLSDLRQRAHESRLNETEQQRLLQT